MGNQSEHGQSIYWKPEAIDLPTQLKSGKLLHTAIEQAGRPCTALEIADSAVQSVSNKFQQLAEVHANRNPEDSPAAHFKKVSSLAEKHGKEARRRLMETQKNLHQRKTNIEEGIAEKLKLNDTPHAEEMRRLIRDMPEDKRSSFILDAISKGDNQVVGAILNGHPALLGLEQKHVDGYRQRYYHIHAKDDLRHMHAIDLARKRIDEQIDATIEAGAAFEKVPAVLAEEARKSDEALAKAQQW